MAKILINCSRGMSDSFKYTVISGETFIEQAEYDRANKELAKLRAKLSEKDVKIEELERLALSRLEMIDKLAEIVNKDSL